MTIDRATIERVLEDARTDPEQLRALRADPVAVLTAAGIDCARLSAEVGEEEDVSGYLPCTFNLTSYDCDPLTCILFSIIQS